MQTENMKSMFISRKKINVQMQPEKIFRRHIKGSLRRLSGSLK